MTFVCRRDDLCHVTVGTTRPLYGAGWVKKKIAEIYANWRFVSLRPCGNIGKQ